MQRWMSLLTAVLLLAGCAWRAQNLERSRSSYYQPAQPVDCRTLQEQVAWLENERPGGPKRVLNTVTLVLPPSWIINALRGKNLDRLKTVSGAYDREIDQQIAHLEEQCRETAGAPANR